MKALHIISYLLLVIGGLNWGLVGLGMFFGGDWNLVHLILGSIPMLEAIVYVLVGLATLWLLFTKRSIWMMHSHMHSDMPKAM